MKERFLILFIQQLALESLSVGTLKNKVSEASSGF
jgi:hypothetical protein